MKAVYVAAYKNLAGLHKLRFADIRKRHVQAVIDNCPLGVIPIVDKIMLFIEKFYNPANEYLLALDGKPLLTVRNLRLQIWNKSPFLTNHPPHDGRHTCATLIDNTGIPLKNFVLCRRERKQTETN